MDEGVGHQLAHRQLGEHGHGLAQGLPHHLVGRQQAVDVADQALEAAGVALPAFLLLERLGATRAAVLDHAHGLAAQRVKGIQALGEQDGAQVGDVPAARLAAVDQPIVRERLQDAVAVRGQRPFEQIEVGRIVEQAQHVVAGRALGGDAILESGRRCVTARVPSRGSLSASSCTSRPG